MFRRHAMHLALRQIACVRTKDPKKISMEILAERGRRTDIRPRQHRLQVSMVGIQYPRGISPKDFERSKIFRLCIIPRPPPHGRTKASTPNTNNIHPTSQQSHIVGIGKRRRRHHDHGDNASDGCKGICTSILYETMDK